LPFVPWCIAGIAIVPILMTIRGLYLLRTATSVYIDQDILRLEGRFLSKTIPWTNLARVRVENRSLLLIDQCDNIVLYGPAGQKLGVIRDIFNKSSELLREIQIRSSAARGQPTTDPNADQADSLAYKRREHIIASMAFVALAGLMTPLTAFVLNFRTAEETLPTKGRQIDAKITRHWFVSDSFWLDYQFTVEGRQFQREVRMNRTAWSNLTHAKTVPVLYFPSDPWHNRLLVGDQEPPMPHLYEMVVGLIVFLLVMSLVALLRYFLVGKSIFPRRAAHSRSL